MENISDSVSIFDVATKFGVTLNGKGNLYHSPFRQDNHPSFSIFSNGKFFKDQATGETGNVVSFLAKVKGISTKEAYRILQSEFGNGSSKAVSSSRDSQDRLTFESVFGEEEYRKVENPPTLQWSDTLAKSLCASRGYEIEALKEAFNRKCFGFTYYKGYETWMIGDSSNRSFQARRTYERTWYFLNNAKAWTLKGSRASYLIGLEAIGRRKYVCLCEGSTDFLACFTFAYKFGCLDEIAPIAMLGAEQRIASEFLRYFNNKKVRIFADNDTAGIEASKRWGEQISHWAESVDILQIPSDFKTEDGNSTKDLCDMCCKLKQISTHLERRNYGENKGSS